MVFLQCFYIISGVFWVVARVPNLAVVNTTKYILPSVIVHMTCSFDSMLTLTFKQHNSNTFSVIPGKI